MSRSSSSWGTARVLRRAVFREELAVTRLTFTSVVCAERITETSNSAGRERQRDRRIGMLDGQPLDHRPDPVPLRADYFRRASRTKLRGTGAQSGVEHPFGVRPPDRGPAQTRSSAGHPAQAKSLGEWVELSRLNARDSRGQLSFERRDLVAREHRRNDRVRALEEVVDDFDVLRARPEARKRIDQPLQAVVAVDDLLPASSRRSRSSCSRRRARAHRRGA